MLLAWLINPVTTSIFHAHSMNSNSSKLGVGLLTSLFWCDECRRVGRPFAVLPPTLHLG